MTALEARWPDSWKVGKLEVMGAYHLAKKSGNFS